jgi:thiamine-phosphate pyrophosphorylase
VSLPKPPLLIISDRSRARAPITEVAAAAFGAGGRWLMLREKDLDAGARLALLRELVALGAAFGAAITVNGDLAAAGAAGAAGVHLPAGGELAAARAALGPGALIGVSTHDATEAEAAAEAGADYVTLSPVFESASKPGYGPALGLAALRAAAARSPVPVLALGGIGAANAGSCLGAGAAGVAVMGAVMGAADPGAAVAALLAAMAPPPDSG